MAQEPSAGTEVGAQRRRNCQFTPAQKEAMCRQLSSCLSFRRVARDFDTSPSAVHRIFRQWKSTGTTEVRPRAGRPHKLTPAERRYVALLVKRDRRITCRALVAALGGRVSAQTMRRVLRALRAEPATEG